MFKVALRKKKISKGRLSLYLDIYPKIINPATGRLTRYRFLGLYLFSQPSTLLEKNHNVQTLDLAINICANAQLEIQNKRFGFIPNSKRDNSFIDFFESCLKGRTGSDLAIWKSAMLHFKSFIGGSLAFWQINEMLCERFRAYIQKATSLKTKKKVLNINTASSYIGKFKYALKEAFKRKLLLEDLGDFLRNIPERESDRDWLTREELQKLADTECKCEVVKRASLFSALTGMRFSDIVMLKWLNVRCTEENVI